MNRDALQKAIEVIKEEVGAALLATNIVATKDGTPIVGYNDQPKACALFTKVIKNINIALKESGYPKISKYYLFNLATDKIGFVIWLDDEYHWGFLVDSLKISLGTLIHIVIPKAIEIFEEAKLQIDNPF